MDFAPSALILFIEKHKQSQTFPRSPRSSSARSLERIPSDESMISAGADGDDNINDNDSGALQVESRPPGFVFSGPHPRRTKSQTDKSTQPIPHLRKSTSQLTVSSHADLSQLAKANPLDQLRNRVRQSKVSWQVMFRRNPIHEAILADKGRKGTSSAAIKKVCARAHPRASAPGPPRDFPSP